TCESKATSQAKLKASSPAFRPSTSKLKQLSISDMPSSKSGASSSSKNISNSYSNSNSNSNKSKQLKIAPAFTPRQLLQKKGADPKPDEDGAWQTQDSPSKPHASAGTAAGDIASADKRYAEDDYFLKLPQASSQMPYMKPVGYFAIDEALRRVLTGEMRAESTVVESDLPFQIHNYCSLSPIENIDLYDASGSFSVQSIKAQSIVDGRHYRLHRINQPLSAPQVVLNAIDRWKAVQSPGVAQVHEAFTTRAFGDNSLVIVHDYKPLATSLKAKIIDSGVVVSEAFLWSLVLQLASALRAVHSAGLAVQLLSASTISISPTNRVYINLCGLADVLALSGGFNMNSAQQGDLHAIGRILGAIIGTSHENLISLQGQAQVVVPGAGFSVEFKELFSYLNRRLTPVIAIDDILRLAGSRVFAELDAVRRDADLLHDTLRLEMANGRLVRLLCKMNFVTERAENNMDPEWSETGDRYLIKLFRDYVFHLVNESGKPVADMAHVVGNLNKLDAGSDEKVMLMSRDEKSCLVVSYREIKRCVEDAYKELVAPTKGKAWQ
ncbi:PAB-dependent poly(A)-specific ribonuclease subunit 3, partial [Coemansia sp. RSA 2598]